MVSSLWKRAAGALKDRSSLCIAKLAALNGFRNPDLESAIIMATSHDESTIDYKSAQRVFAWVRTSPTFVKPLIWSLTKRVEKTRSWVVALKALMLMHGVFCVKIPTLRKVGRLPFDLSKFQDRYSEPAKACALSSFIRAYYAFLDQRSTFLSYSNELQSMEGALIELQRSQILLNLLLQIRPNANGLNLSLILEAMDCVVIEIFEVYSGICNGIATVLGRIYMAGNDEGMMALKVLQKAASQSKQLSSYFEVCRSLGVLKAAELPQVEQIPDEDLRDIESMICGVSLNGYLTFSPEECLERKEKVEKEKDWKEFSETVVTQNWVVFPDEFQIAVGGRTGDLDQVSNDVLREGYRDWEKFLRWHQEQNCSLLHHNYYLYDGREGTCYNTGL